MNSVDKARIALAQLAEERPHFFQSSLEKALWRCGFVFGFEAARAEAKAEALRRGTVPQKAA